MSLHGTHESFGSRARPAGGSLAWTVSVIAHLTLIYVASRWSWASTIDLERSSPATVVWLASLPRPEPPPLFPPEPLEVLEAEQPPPSADEPSEPATQPETAPAEARSAPSNAIVPESATAPTPPQAAPPNRLRPNVDWNAERQNAIASVIEEREREQNYRTFSLADVLDEEPPPPAEPTPERSFFEPCPVVGSRMKKFAMMLVGRCARVEARADMFAHIKPAYLDMRPLCTDVPTATAAATDVTTEPRTPTAATAQFDSDGVPLPPQFSDGVVATAATSVKCRLATEAEIARVYAQDPSLFDASAVTVD
jgi:hypothetical protein